MDELEKIPKTYVDAIEVLARWHAEGSGNMEILSFPDPQQRIVRLVEISDDFPDSGDTSPIAFGPSSEFPFPSGVILLSRDDWAKVKHGELSLPEEWDRKDEHKVWPN